MLPDPESEVPEIREMLALLAEHECFFDSPPKHMRRQFAAGGLARCRALLEGVLVLQDHGRSDVAGVLWRATLECFLVSVYVLSKGEKGNNAVIDEALADYAHWMSKIGG